MSDKGSAGSSFFRPRRSLFTGELGLSEAGGVRLKAGGWVGPLEGVMFSKREFPHQDFAKWGFEPVATRDPTVSLPWLTLAADVAGRYDVDLLDTTVLSSPEAIAGLVFGEPHSDEWWNAVHRNQKLIVYVGDPAALVNAVTSQAGIEVMRDAWVGISPLLIRGYADGVGTAAPGQ